MNAIIILFARVQNFKRASVFVCVCNRYRSAHGCRVVYPAHKWTEAINSRWGSTFEENCLLHSSMCSSVKSYAIFCAHMPLLCADVHYNVDTSQCCVIACTNSKPMTKFKYLHNLAQVSNYFFIFFARSDSDEKAAPAVSFRWVSI